MSPVRPPGGGPSFDGMGSPMRQTSNALQLTSRPIDGVRRSDHDSTTVCSCESGEVNSSIPGTRRPLYRSGARRDGRDPPPSRSARPTRAARTKRSEPVQSRDIIIRVVVSESSPVPGLKHAGPDSLPGPRPSRPVVESSTTGEKRGRRNECHARPISRAGRGRHGRPRGRPRRCMCAGGREPSRGEVTSDTNRWRSLAARMRTAAGRVCRALRPPSRAMNASAPRSCGGRETCEARLRDESRRPRRMRRDGEPDQSAGPRAAHARGRL